MPYCTADETPLITYQFANSPTNLIYKAPIAPVDISVGQLYGWDDGWCNGLPYRLKFNAYNTAGRLIFNSVNGQTASFWGQLLGMRFRRQDGTAFFWDIFAYGNANPYMQGSHPNGYGWIRRPMQSSPVWSDGQALYGAIANPTADGYSKEDATDIRILDVYLDTASEDGFPNLYPKIADRNAHCGSTCEIKVSKNGVLLYSDRGKCPCTFEVTCSGGKCPPETACECDCGDVICCYGSNGQVLKTISK